MQARDGTLLWLVMGRYPPLTLLLIGVIRGLGGTADPMPGRRVLAQPMHDLPAANLIDLDGPDFQSMGPAPNE